MHATAYTKRLFCKVFSFKMDLVRESRLILKEKRLHIPAGFARNLGYCFTPASRRDMVRSVWTTSAEAA